jgi:hypothetical protein
VTPVEMDVDAAHALVDAHLWGPVREQPSVQHVEYDPELRRWYVRFGCDGRDAATIYFDLHQRTLRYELYFLPSPEDEARRAELHAWLLRRNHDLYGARFSLGPDGDVYLTGRVALEHLTEQELDRLIGVLFELTERWFQPAVTIAFRPRAEAGPEEPTS